MYFGLSHLVKGVDFSQRQLMFFTLEAYMLLIKISIIY